MGSGTQVDQDDFKAVVEQFAGWVKVNQDELDKQVNTNKAKSSRFYEMVCLQSAIVFGLDNEPIPGINVLSSTLQSNSFIALNLLAWVTANKNFYLHCQELANINGHSSAWQENC